VQRPQRAGPRGSHRPQGRGSNIIYKKLPGHRHRSRWTLFIAADVVKWGTAIRNAKIEPQ
jgi:hypothetical protein